jgi:hypothetical protein
MKTWYLAVCQEHGEAIDIFVSNPSCTAAYLSEHDAQIQVWLEDHYGCDLLMIGNDLQKEKYLYDVGWVEVGGSKGLRIWMRP